MNKSGSRAVAAVLFWGGLWGIAEAVVGHALHLIRVPGLAGWVMFPFGLWMMRQAFRRSGRTLALAGVPAVAAAVKLADFILPVSDPFIVINPAAAILIEGFAAAVLLLGARKRTPTFASLLSAAAAWRVAYFGWGLASSALPHASNRFGGAGFDPWSFFALDSLINATLIGAGFEVAKRRPSVRVGDGILGWAERITAWPIAAGATVLAAVAAEILSR
jgi:hypothetical protein